MTPSESPYICWKTLAFLPLDPPIHDSTVLFNIAAGTGLYRQFDLDPALAYVPYILSPTTVYHQLLRNTLKQKGIELEGSKYPYRIDLPGCGTASLNVRIRLYPPNILSLTTNLSKFPEPKYPAVDWFVELQHLDNCSPVKNIIEFTVDAAASLSHKTIARCSVRLDSKPCLYLNAPHLWSREEQRHKAATPKQYVAILIRNADEQLRDEIVDSC